jgi:hypothetical protein
VFAFELTRECTRPVAERLQQALLHARRRRIIAGQQRFLKVREGRMCLQQVQSLDKGI